MSDLFSFHNIYACYLKCRKRKRGTINALRFEMRLEDNLCKLERELKTKTYQPARSVCFVARKPKLREIFAADFKDRIVHHILVDYLEKIYEQIFIYDSYACRMGKGTLAAVQRLQKFIRSITSNGVICAFYIQMDIKSFFVNINKDILKGLIRKKTGNKDILWLLNKILDNNCAENYVLRGNPRLIEKVPSHKTLFNSPSNKGLPIGNLTSQFFANVYLNELDQFIKHGLKARYYIRYVDDFVLLSKNKKELILWKAQIEKFLKERLDLELNSQRERIRPISNGIDFLGYIVRPAYTLVRRRVVNNCKSKLREINDKVFAKTNSSNFLQFNPILVKKVKQLFSSYLAHFNQVNSYRLKKSITDKFSFVYDYCRYFDLTLQHNFSSLKRQYCFFENKFSTKDMIFFQVGCFYKIFRKETAKVLGLKVIETGKKCFAGFPVRFEKKYADISIKNGHDVYVVNQSTGDVFNSKVLPRMLTKKYPVAM